jgi:uncharacterized membrane protein YdjX (TVP38/TMEM64 family)
MNAEPASENQPAEFQTGGGIKRLAGFIVLATLCLVIGYFTPLRDYFTVDAIQGFAKRLGVWGPAVLAAAGIITPLLFIPRWPIAFVGGALYGITEGSIIANVASTIGAYLSFLLARTLLRPMAEKLRRKYGIHAAAAAPGKVFWVLFLLRAFPLSNFVATNLLAGAMQIRTGTYLAASFLGMIPSTLMYAAWGKLVKKPEPVYYVLAVGILIVLLVGTLVAQRRFMPWFKKVAAPPPGNG